MHIPSDQATNIIILLHNRPHPAGEVLITGTFDEWRGSIKLCKNESGLFTALVDLSDAEKVHYKVKRQ